MMKRKRKEITLVFAAAVIFIFACNPDHAHDEMKQIVKRVYLETNRFPNQFASQAKVAHYDSMIQKSNGITEANYNKLLKANALLEASDVPGSIALCLEVLPDSGKNSSNIKALKTLAIAYMRLGETSNCIANHSGESCILPIKGLGRHRNEEGSRQAIALYSRILSQSQNDLESKWLLNLAYMTVGEYPDKVPASWLIPGMQGDTIDKVLPFTDIAGHLGLDINNMAGGSIVDDFNNDGYLDVVTSSWGLDEEMHYFQNNVDGTFANRSLESGLSAITGGLNIVQADYNNDGFLDILVLRGAWFASFGKQPNSLLRNNGDGTFNDVTIECGLLSFHPTQAAVWSDLNNDGWLDLFIGNENPSTHNAKMHPSELFINNQDGTFTEVAEKTNTKFYLFVKGVTAGDFDRDGWQDIFISTMNGNGVLLRNKTGAAGSLDFENITEKAGLADVQASTFATWFFDFNNDGWLDLVSCNYDFKASLSNYAAAYMLGIPIKDAGAIYLYKNNGNGTFSNITEAAGLNKPVFAMGANFGDIDNDGFLDMYFATGNPNFESLIPNRLFRNIGGEKFADVTSSARVGHLQKGHGVSFADIDNDGDQDIYVDMGGAYKGDTYQNALYQNPGGTLNNWICFQLEGTKANRSAIGTRIKITITENGLHRIIIRDVNSGGSFGSSPLRKEIGLGGASNISEIEIRWHGSNTVQIFKNVVPNQFYKLKEGKELERIDLKKIEWKITDPLCLP